jgi:hypothetical protein
VNDGLHRNLVESLRMITRGTRRIIMLPIGCAIVASELFLTSVAGYVPFERRNTRLSGHSHGVFQPGGLCRDAPVPRRGSPGHAFTRLAQEDLPAA